MNMTKTKILILGLGNTLFSDDGVGVHVVNNLQKNHSKNQHAKFVDGGTIGLNLLLELEGTNGIIAVDAGMIGKPAGSIHVFEGVDMDDRLAAKKRTPHEVTLADLMTAAVLTDMRPDNRALVCIEPEDIDWGDYPSKPVSKAMIEVEKIIMQMVAKWSEENKAANANPVTKGDQRIDQVGASL